MRELLPLAVALCACGAHAVASTSYDGGAGAADATTDAPDSIDASPMDTSLIDDVPLEPEACSSNFAGDPHNCGSCGNDCSPAGCAAGLCTTAPTVLAKAASPTYVAVDATNVYWSTDGSPRTIQARPLAGDGGVPSTLWSGTQAIGDLAVQGSQIVWPATAGYGPFTSGVVTCPTSGCAGAATILVLFPNLGINGFGTDATTAYFSTGPVASCALGGCSMMASTIYDYPDASANGASRLAVGGGNLAWIDAMGNLSTCPTSGCQGAPTLVGTLSIRVLQLAVDSTRVYWLDPGIAPPAKTTEPYTDGKVLACPLTGCGSGPVVLASYASWWQPGVIATDGVNVYWTYEDASRGFGVLERCGVGGCNGQPDSLAVTAASYGPSLGLALDATRVYWNDFDLGEILAAPK